MRTNRYLYKQTITEEEKVAENGNLEEINFIQLVKQMRHYQRRYFATRNEEILKECRKLEAEVDRYITQKNEIQLKLF